ncbi:MAG: hypothetical protein JW763_00700 [candidate division Zixibacteria bacterium]|nr:hypothetical protein [candidate division Zixibacteria bacterium]
MNRNSSTMTLYRHIAVFGALFLLLPALLYAIDPTAYVVNSEGETLSKINLTTGVVSNNIVILGTDVDCYPNQIIIRDTLAYVINSGTDEIQIIDLVTEQTVSFINTGASTNPYWMEFSDDRYAFVSFLLTNELAKVDMQKGNVVQTIPVGHSPEGVLITQGKVYVANSGYNWGTGDWEIGSVMVYDIASEMIIDTVYVDWNPQYMALDDSGRIHVVCTGDYYSSFGAIDVIDPATDTIMASFSIGGSPGQITIGPDHVAYLAGAGWTFSGYVYSYNSLNFDIYHDQSNPITVDLNCMTAVAYQDSTCFTGSFTDFINIIDSSGGDLGSYAVGDAPVHIDFNYLPGDANSDFAVNLLDILFLIDWIYTEGPKPSYAMWRANANGDFAYNLLDILYLIEYVYSDGPRPKVGPR